MKRELTGMVRWRLNKRWLLTPAPVLQVQVHCVGKEARFPGILVWVDKVIWRDAAPADLELLCWPEGNERAFLVPALPPTVKSSKQLITISGRWYT